ncbi:hypothetical protein E2C01_084762 [Portunus trituberculatus]|uniref:Uncharacterized protein n=1 Tax=Portunus trituberculatus TaxID=210409 RepID=A0A5B7J5P1_PORTR|nr:hypothetical protein [Portunus trituberculatus]
MEAGRTHTAGGAYSSERRAGRQTTSTNRSATTRLAMKMLVEAARRSLSRTTSTGTNTFPTCNTPRYMVKQYTKAKWKTPLEEKMELRNKKT